MHELPVIEKILDIALRHARKNDAARIHSITLRVGGLTDLEDTWMQHYFDYLSKATIASGARLIIINEPARLRCGKCKTIIETTRDEIEEKQCPHCGADAGFSILSGREYYIEEMTAQ